MNILVIDVYSLHLGYLGCYGNDWVLTRELDRLAAQGVVFDQHYVDRPRFAVSKDVLDLPGSWTGRYSVPTLDPAGSGGAPAGLAELVERHNIQCGRFRPESVMTWHDEAALALDRLSHQEPWILWVDGPDLAPPWDLGAEPLEEFFPDYQDADDEMLRPWLEPPPGPLPEDSEVLLRLQDTYAAAILAFDSGLAALVRHLQKRKHWDDVVLCVTAQSGLPMGEHGFFGLYRARLHEEVWHVPLILRLPDEAQAGLRIGNLSQNVDLVPTLLDLLGTPPPLSQGCNLRSLLAGDPSPVRPYVCGGWQLGWDLQWILRTPDWALVLQAACPPGESLSTAKLFAKPDDRWEVNDVRQHHLEWSEGLEQTLRAFVASQRSASFNMPPLPTDDTSAKGIT